MKADAALRRGVAPVDAHHHRMRAGGEGCPSFEGQVRATVPAQRPPVDPHFGLEVRRGEAERIRAGGGRREGRAVPGDAAFVVSPPSRAFDVRGVDHAWDAHRPPGEPAALPSLGEAPIGGVESHRPVRERAAPAGAAGCRRRAGRRLRGRRRRGERSTGARGGEQRSSRGSGHVSRSVSLQQPRASVRAPLGAPARPCRRRRAAVPAAAGRRPSTGAR